MTQDPLRHHRAHRAQGLIGDRWSERMVEKVAETIGTTAFLATALTIIVAWILINGGYAFFSGAITALADGKHFDPAPFILLNLCFSFEAFFTGSLVVIAAKAQAKRDRAREEADAKHREDLAAMQQTLLNAIHDKVREDTPGGIATVIAKQTELEKIITGRG